MYTRQNLVKKSFLLLAIAGLFTACQGGNSGTGTNATGSEGQAESANIQKLAFVDIDTLEAQYSYFIEKRAELEKKKENAQNELTAKEKQLQNEYNALVQRAPQMTQAEGQVAEAGFQRKAQQHEIHRQNLIAQLQTQEAQFNEDLQSRLDACIKDYNADKKYAFIFSYRTGASNILFKDDSYDITKEIIQLLNASEAKK